MSGVIKAVSKAVSSVGTELGNLGSSIDKRVIQPVLKDPVEAIATAVGYYYGGPAGAAAARGTVKLAQGEDPEDAAKAAATTYVFSSAAGAVGGTTGGSETGAFDIGGNPDILGGSSAGMFGGAAPIETATPSTPEQIYPGVEKGAYTPVPGSFQSTLPELGVQTAASAPYTAIPGSLEAIVAGSPIAGANPSLSIQDAFRAARTINNLLAQRQQPQINPYSLIGQQQQPGLVSYEELLGLLGSQKARTPNVAPIVSGGLLA